jgi:hypothetical protein
MAPMFVKPLKKAECTALREFARSPRSANVGPVVVNIVVREARVLGLLISPVMLGRRDTAEVLIGAVHAFLGIREPSSSSRLLISAQISKPRSPAAGCNRG